MWYQHWRHPNSFAHLQHTKWGYNLRWYWKQYTSGTMQRDVSVRMSIVNKEWYKSEEAALDTLAKQGYKEATRQDFTIDKIVRGPDERD